LKKREKFLPSLRPILSPHLAAIHKAQRVRQERMIGQGIEIRGQLAGLSKPRFPRLAFGQEMAESFECLLRRGALAEGAGGEEQNKSDFIARC
jgi:hypothetical protein